MTDNSNALLRREQRERIAKGRAVVRAMKKVVGLPVKRVTVDGVEIEFSEPSAPAVGNELDQWLLKHPDLGTDHARSVKRH